MELTKRDRLGTDLARQQTKLIRELKAVRVSSEATVTEVATTMGVDDAVVYRFEKGGTNPTLATVRRYALAVGAMLDLSAASVSSHTKKTVQEAADSIVSEPAKHADFVIFHTLDAAPRWLTGRGTEVADQPPATRWKVAVRG